MGHIGIVSAWYYEMPVLLWDKGVGRGHDTTVRVTVEYECGSLVLRVAVKPWVADQLKLLHLECTPSDCAWCRNGDHGIWWLESRREMDVTLPMLWRQAARDLAAALDEVARTDFEKDENRGSAVG